MPLGKEAGLGPGHIVSDGDPATPTAAPLHFRPMPIVAKRSPISATAELLFKIVAVQHIAFYKSRLLNCEYGSKGLSASSRKTVHIWRSFNLSKWDPSITLYFRN